MPSPYRGLAQQEAKAKASALGGQVKPPEDALAAKVYQAEWHNFGDVWGGAREVERWGKDGLRRMLGYVWVEFDQKKA